MNGVTVDLSSAERIRGDLAQAFADSTAVRVRGNLIDGICVAERAEVHDN